MLTPTWLLSLCLAVQIPPPAPAQADTRLKETAKAIHQREIKDLESLAAKLAGRAKADEIAAIRRLAPPSKAADGATRLALLPEVVPAQAEGLASVPSGSRKPLGKEISGDWRMDLRQIRERTASELFALAKKAGTGTTPHYALAAVCLREVLKLQPDHAEARRLLGYVPYEGGWARPFAVNRLKEGSVNHPVYGWVPAEWVPHLEIGELPAPGSRGERQVQWLPAAQADALRSNWKSPWQIRTEHFEIKSDVPLGEAIEFARRLEGFYDFFFTLMADLVGENLPLARRFRSPNLTADAAYRPHQVFYFATHGEYVDYLQARFGGDPADSLGYYQPLRSSKGNRAPAYFFRDPDGQIPVTATLYHEVSHQLLFETAGPNHYKNNAGNYWVFEGLGTYFETVTPRPDGTIEAGGLVGERIAAAQQSLAAGRFLPLDQFLRLDHLSFNRADRIHVNYQQAMALTVFLMQWHDGAYRDAFLDYVYDAYRGRLKRNAGRLLEDRLGQSVKVLDSQFREFLSQPKARARD